MHTYRIGHIPIMETKEQEPNKLKEILSQIVFESEENREKTDIAFEHEDDRERTDLLLDRLIARYEWAGWIRKERICQLRSRINTKDFVMKIVDDFDCYENELKILIDLKGLHRTIPLIDYEYIPETRFNMLLFEYYFFPPPSVIHQRNQVQTYMNYLLEAIEYIHSKGIVHRDIKTSNIGVTFDGDTVADLVLADFGLAGYQSDKLTLRQTVGTEAYRAPEMLVNPEYGNNVDIWSAGVVFAQLLTGGDDLFETDLSVQEAVRDKGKWMKEFHLDIEKNNQALDLLWKMLALNPTERISASNALEHEYFKSTYNPKRSRKYIWKFAH